MNTNRAILIGIVVGIVTSAVILASNDVFIVNAQMGGMTGGSNGGMSHDINEQIWSQRKAATAS